MTHFLLKLYIAGRTPRAERAIANIEELCTSGDLPGDYELVVIDVLERPQLAENEKILATPTLVKELPPPLRRVVGDLSDRERILVGLDLAVRED
jgi:circadian clock protein KaiB